MPLFFARGLYLAMLRVTRLLNIKVLTILVLNVSLKFPKTTVLKSFTFLHERKRCGSKRSIPFLLFHLIENDSNWIRFSSVPKKVRSRYPVPKQERIHAYSWKRKAHRDILGRDSLGNLQNLIFKYFISGEFNRVIFSIYYDWIRNIFFAGSLALVRDFED